MTTKTELSAKQKEILKATASGLVVHGRPVLARTKVVRQYSLSAAESLVKKGLLQKGRLSNRVSWYELTDAGRAAWNEVQS